MSLNYYFHIKKTNPSPEDYYNYMLKAYANFKIDATLVHFTTPNKRPKKFETEKVFYPITLNEFIVSNFKERIFHAKYPFELEVLFSFDNRHVLFYMDNNEVKEIDYVITSNRVKLCNIFDLIDLIGTIFFR